MRALRTLLLSAADNRAGEVGSEGLVGLQAVLSRVVRVRKDERKYSIGNDETVKHLLNYK